MCDHGGLSGRGEAFDGAGRDWGKAGGCYWIACSHALFLTKTIGKAIPVLQMR